MSTFLHSGDMGDIVHSLASVKALGGGVYYLCSRPWTKEMTPARFEALSALMRAQPYIKGVEWHKGQKVKYDFTDFRKHYKRGPGRNLATMHALALNPGLCIDTRAPWISVPEFSYHGRPVIARSPRYHCVDDISVPVRCDRWERIWPEILDCYPDPIFVGLPEEHQAFQKAFQTRVDYVRTHDYLHLAKLIKGSSIFIGNQSSPMCVAEGLKHRSIQETHWKVNDVVFERPNGHYVRSYKEWTEIREQNHFGIMFQFSPHDYAQAVDLARLIVDLEPRARNDVEIILAGRFDMTNRQMEDLREIFSPIFRTIAMRCERRGDGWPRGCNELWAGCMTQLCYTRSQGNLRAEAVFTMEPDCLPLRRDWINQLKASWGQAKSNGKIITGHLCRNEEGIETHINGNLIVSTSVSKHCPRLIQGASSNQPWDCYHGQTLLKLGQDTASIYQNKRRESFSIQDWKTVTKAGKRPAIWHGIKSADGLRIARQELVEKENPAPLESGAQTALEI